jgi:pyruvoyl-dependent arginine decarboxylase
LNAFDNALLAAGIHDCNLIPVSSILAKGTRILKRFRIRTGAFVPCVLSVAHGKRGERISAGVAAGFNDNGYGFVVEGRDTRQGTVLGRLEKQLAEMAAVRGQRVLRSQSRSEALTVTKRHGCCVAACVLLF